MKTKEIVFKEVRYFVGNKQVSKQEAIKHVAQKTIQIRSWGNEEYFQTLAYRTGKKRKAARASKVFQEERAPSEAYIS